MAKYKKNNPKGKPMSTTARGGKGASTCPVPKKDGRYGAKM